MAAALEAPPVVAAVAPADPVPDEQAKAQAQRWKKRIKHFAAQLDEHVTRWKRNRKAVNGELHDDGGPDLVRVNLAASIVNTIQPNIYAKAPEVSVQPEERVSQGDYAGTKDFARTLELVLNRYAIRGANLKARGKEAVRSSLTCTTGWVKVIYQKDKREDPLVRNRINDAQDNIQRVEQLVRETADEGQCAEYEAKMAELRQQLEAMQAQLEIVVSEGVVIDNVAAEHILILDASVKSIDEYDQASAIAHGVFMTVGAYKANFGGKEPPKKATRYSTLDRTDDDASDMRQRNGMDPDDELVRVWEIWSKDDLTVYTQCDGADEYCRPPYQPQTLGARWYPFFPLQLWRVNGYLLARTLVDNLIELVDEYNTRRTVAAEHRRKNLPVRLLNRASGISNAQITAINTRGAGTDIIGVDADPNVPLANQLGSLPEIPYNPAMYDTNDILRDVEMVSGAQDASRGAINKAKTATEAEIMSAGMQSRTAEQLDTIEDWLTAILTYCSQLLLLNLTPQQVQGKFGQDAVWPELSKKELFEQVMVTIRAGSTAKPNKMRERDQWLQFMPQMQEAVMKIAELRNAGHDDMADAIIKLLDETLRRFDERMSIAEFVPGQGQDGEPGKPDMQKMLTAVKQKVAELVKQAEEQMAAQRGELAKREADAAKRDTDLRVREIEQKAAEDVAALRSQYQDAGQQLAMREAGDKIIGQVRDLLEKHEEAVQALIGGTAPLPPELPLIDEAEAALQGQVDAILAEGLQPVLAGEGFAPPV